MDHKKKKKLKDGWHRVVLSEDIDKHERSKELQFYTKQRWRRRRGRRVPVNAKNIYNGAHVRDQEIHPRWRFYYSSEWRFPAKEGGVLHHRRNVLWVVPVTLWGGHGEFFRDWLQEII